MKKFLLLILLALAGVAAWFFWETRSKPKDETPKPAPLAVSKHSETFNLSVGSTLDAYYALSEALVNWDTSAVQGQAARMKTSIDNMKLDDLKKDTGIYETAKKIVIITLSIIVVLNSCVIRAINNNPNLVPVRFSFCKYNTTAEIDTVIEKLKEII